MYRCIDCGLGGALSCQECCVHLHTHLPFHQIKKWNGRFFERSDLDILDLVISLGHSGQLCPGYASQVLGREEGVDSEWVDVEGLDEADLVEDEGLLCCGMEMGSKVQENRSGDYMVFVDISGVFQRRIQPCVCINAPPLHLQLFQMELFPATITKPSTAFTFRLLDQFHLESMECKTPANSFYSKLRRCTNEAFPSSVPVGIQYPCISNLSNHSNLLQDRYRELMRVSRQWRNLQALKRSGFGHCPELARKPGDLATFCATCPQPGVNVPLTVNLDGTDLCVIPA